LFLLESRMRNWIEGQLPAGGATDRPGVSP